MAILARAMVTLASIKDVASVTRFYRLLSSTASKPSTPTTNPPESSWSTTEPTYSEETTSTLYFVDLTVFSDGSYTYSDVSQSTSYEAAKSAYNVAQNAKDVADSAQDSIDNLSIGGRNLLLDTDAPSLEKIAAKENRFFSDSSVTNIVPDFITVNDAPINVSNGTTFTSTVATGTTSGKCLAWYSGDVVPLIDGETYTLSFYARVTSGDIMGIRLLYGVSPYYENNFNIESKEWTRYYWTFSANISGKGARVYIGASSYYLGTVEICGYKLERGNKATDWTPAPEDVEETVKRSAISNINIGGRNLLLNSSFSENFNKWTNQGTTPNDYYEIVTEDGYKCAHATCGFGVYRNKRQNITNKIKDDNIENTVYTVSFDMKLVNYVAGSKNPYLKVYFTGNYINSSGQTKTLYATFQNEDPDLAPYNNMGWVRVIVSNIKFEQQPSNMNFTIYSRDWEGDLYYKNLKLERGNKATDWSPAPEDIDESINSVTIESTSDNFINYTFDGSKIYYPSTITLTPFINGNIEFSKWQYKLINGDTWIDVVSGSNGLTVESDNTLTISNSCSLFTDTCSAIVFKCLSDNNTFYSSKTIVREDDPTRVYNTVKTRIDQTDDNLSLIASATELVEYSTSSTLNSRLANVSVSSDEILMVVSQSVNNLSTANGIKGVYDEAVSYATNNIVVLNGKFYKAKKASTGKTPPNTTYWTDVTSQYSETTLKTAFSKIVALQDSITLQVSGSNGNSAINLTDGTLSLTVTDVANILANKELNLTSENGVINITGGGGVNIGTSSSGAITINSPNFTLNKNGDIESNSGVVGGWHITSQDLTRHSINLIEDYTSYIANNYNPWKMGRNYFVGDIISTNLIIPNNGSGNVTFDNYKCIENHTATDFQSQKNTYWELIESVNYSVDNLTQYKIYNMDIDSYNSAISISEEHYDINDSSFDLTKSFSLSVDGLAVYSSISEVGTEVKYDGIYHRIHYGDDNSTLNISSSGYLSLVGDKGVSINGFNIGDSQEVLSIGNGTITDAISVLYSNKSNALSRGAYNAADETIPTSEMKEFSINIASSGRKAIGIIGCVALGSASACLCGFWLDGDTTAKVRIRNMSNTSITCHPRVIVLYVDND